MSDMMTPRVAAMSELQRAAYRVSAAHASILQHVPNDRHWAAVRGIGEFDKLMHELWSALPGNLDDDDWDALWSCSAATVDGGEGER